MHKIALYKNEIISSLDESLLHIKIFCAIGILFVKYLYNWNISFSSIEHEYIILKDYQILKDYF